MRIVVLGGAGFIGSSLTRMLLGQNGASILVIDAMTPTASLASLALVASSPRFGLRKVDVRDRGRVEALMHSFSPDAVIDATSSTEGEDDATAHLVEAVRGYTAKLSTERAAAFRFVEISSGPELSTRAVALLEAHRAGAFQALVVRSAPAFGPHQFPDRSVAAMVVAALGGRQIELSCAAQPWIFIDDLVTAVIAAVRCGVPGQVYDAAGRGRVRAAALSTKVAAVIERQAPTRASQALRPLSRPVLVEEAADGQAQRSEATNSVPGWHPAESLDSAVSQTVRWYLANEAWWRPLDAARDAAGTYGLLRIA